MPEEEPQAPPAPSGRPAWGKASFDRARSALSPWAWQIATAVLVLAFVISVVRPWAPSPPDPTGDDVAAQWDESISRLGIEPVYPPEEDIYVGDVFAIITGAGSAAGAPTFIGTSVKLDHVSVRWAFEPKGSELPTFPATRSKRGNEPSAQDDAELDPEHRFADRPIRLSLVAFPGVTIVHDARNGASLGFAGNGAATHRDASRVEEIHIPVAETYGISTPDAVSALDQWCDAPETRPMCTRSFALRMLSFVLGRDILHDDPNRPDHRPTVGLLLISRAYAAREFDLSRSFSVDRGGAVAIDPAAWPSGPAEAASDPEKSAGEAPQATEGTPGRDAMTASRSTRISEGVRQIFERPVVFGFRSVKRDLD